MEVPEGGQRAASLLYAACLVALIPALALAQPTEPVPPDEQPVPAPEQPQPSPGSDYDAPLELQSRHEVSPTPASEPQPPAEPSTPATEAEPPSRAPADELSFGSYGRVGFSTNLRGAAGRSTNVVAHGSRLDERPYLELDFRYRLGDPEARHAVTVTTVAFDDDLFHFNGRFDATPALRNLYLEVNNTLARGLSFWAGSRMYRGDDIYLFDFWPLDNLNTVGAGIIARRGDYEARLHVGVNRLDDEFYFQTIVAPAPQFGTEDVIWLDRQRTIGSLRLERLFAPADRARGMKLVAYAEAHSVGSGSLREALEIREELPKDGGFVVGAEVGAWGFAPRSFLNLFVRYASGLAAYGDLSVPFGLSTDKTTRGASEVLAAFAGDYELGRLAIQLGAYVRYFVDADPNVYDRDDLIEFITAVRPHIYLTESFVQAFEISYQGRRSNGLSPNVDAHLQPAVLRLSVLPILSPLGSGTFTRPHLRGIYTLSVRNAGARDLENLLDARRARTVEHFLGIQAEWWFNSSYR